MSTGLWLNGNRWWTRVRPLPQRKPCSVSTDTDDEKRAKKIRAMLDEMEEERTQWDWLVRIAAKEVKLGVVYDARVRGELGSLRKSLDERAAGTADADIEPWVGKWDEHLTLLERNGKLGAAVHAQYLRQVRALVPVGHRFPRSRFTEDFLKDTLFDLKDPRTGELLSSSTRRRYFVAWQLFFKYARRRVPIDTNPFDGIDWMPENNPARSIYWDHATTMEVLNRLEGEHRVFMALVFGTGMELGAALAFEGRHWKKHLTVVAPGTKNETRRDRTIFIDQWAYDIVEPHMKNITPRASAWTDVGSEGDTVRDAFYAAQLAASLVNEPPKSEKTGKLLWGQVKGLHTIHDARHTYCFVRALGDDGEPRQSLEFLKDQLGHADEQMVMRIYKKANIAQQLKLKELAEARQQGRDAAVAAGEPK